MFADVARRTMAAAVLVSALTAPARAANPPAGFAQTVAAMNRDGFAAFASYGASYQRATGIDEPEAAVSPLLRWYVHRFLTLRSNDPAARTLVEQLRGSFIVIETTMRARAGESEYTGAVAAREHDVLGATTLWDPKAAAQYPPGTPLSAWDLEVHIRTDEDDLKSKEFVGFGPFFAPFYARDGIRAIRLDTVYGSRSLFLFSGTRSVLSDLRARMSPALWQSLSAGFDQTKILLPDLNLAFQFDDDFPVGTNEGFGRPVVRTGNSPSGADESIEISASMAKMSVGLSAYVRPFPRLSSPATPPALQPIGSATHHMTTTVAQIPDEHRFSIVAPLLYVVQDNRSGAILLIGEHA